MNTTRTIKVWDWENGFIEATAAPTPTPGLYICEDTANPGTWSIIHLASGAAAALNLDSPEQALDIAIKLGPVGDWTIPAAELLTTPGLLEKRQDILKQAGVLHLQDRKQAPVDVLLRMEPLT